MSTYSESVLEKKPTVQHKEHVERLQGVAEDEDAAGYTDSTVVIDEATNQRLLKMINRRILPCLLLAYLMQALDKSTTGTASIMGLQEDTNMRGQTYALTSTVLWAGIIAGEFPANRLVQILPLGKLLGVSMVLWGIILLGMGLSNDYKPILACRFLLGLFESVIGPACLAVTVMWWRKPEQSYVVSSWQCMLGVNNIISGLLGYGFYHVDDSKLHGWQYLFIGVALLSVLSGVIVGYFLPDSPTKAKCFSEKDKVLFVERVRVNDQGIKNKVFKRDQAIEALKDPLVWLLFALALFNTLVVGGINTFAAILINKNFGFSPLESQLLNIPIGVLTVFYYFLGAWLTTRTKQSLLIMGLFALPNIAGTIVLLTVPNNSGTKVGLLISFYIMQCFQATNPMIFTLLARNISGQTKKSIAYATTFVAWAGGNSIASQLFREKWAPRYIGSLYIHLGLYGCFLVTVAVTRFVLVRRNVKKRAADGHNDNAVHENAFKDLTDIQNPDFRCGCLLLTIQG